MKFRPITPELLTEELLELILATGPGYVRVAVDGARSATDTAALADALAALLRVHGRRALRVRALDFLRPASLRYERGRTDPDSRLDDWLDLGALRREVLEPVHPNGSGEVLPALWDSERDRATRLPRTPLDPGGVVLLDGEFLLGRGLPIDLGVHLWLSPGALARRLPGDRHWALPAYHRYEAEFAPAEHADVVVRVDHPDNPAVRVR